MVRGQLVAALGNPYNLLKESYSNNSHLLHGALFAIAECQIHFPHLIHTERPWKRIINTKILKRACAYG